MKLAAYPRKFLALAARSLPRKPSGAFNAALAVVAIACAGAVSLSLSEPRKKYSVDELIKRQQENQRVRIQGKSPDDVPKGALVPQGPPATVTILATGDVIGYLEPCG